MQCKLKTRAAYGSKPAAVVDPESDGMYGDDAQHQ